MAGIFDVAKEAGSTALSVGVKAIAWGGVILIVGLIVFVVIVIVRNKKIYCMPVRLIRLLDNGAKKEMNGLKGGKVRKKGVFTFEVKFPFKFKKHDLGYMPDFSKTDADNRLVFLSIGDGTLWQQVGEELIKTEKVVINLTQEQIDAQEKLILDYINLDDSLKSKTQKEKENLIKITLDEWIAQNKRKEFEIDLIMKPIKTEVKTATLNSMRSWGEILDRNKLKVFTIAIGAFIIMVVAHLISLYIQTKIKCPVPTP